MFVIARVRRPDRFPIKPNIMIDQTCRARLADFGLLTIVSDPANHISSSSHGKFGTVRWMSPELIDPEKFGYQTIRLTKSSDCYALGMVIYETVSGHMPFHEQIDIVVCVRVIQGKHPTRGSIFPEGLWKMMELCWAYQPDERPSIVDVLQYLRTSSNFPGSPSPQPDCKLVIDDHKLGPISSPPQLLTAKATGEPDFNIFNETDSNFLTSPADLKEGDSYQVSIV